MTDAGKLALAKEALQQIGETVVLGEDDGIDALIKAQEIADLTLGKIDARHVVNKDLLAALRPK
jgi:hypothetical protein